MAQEPRDDTRDFFCRPWLWQLALNKGSAFPAGSNATVNTTHTTFGGDQSSFNYMIIIIPMALLIILCGLVGNGTVIWLLGFRVKRNPFSVYILNLAIADFAYLLFTIVVLLLLINHAADLIQFVLPVLSTCYLAGLSLLMAVSVQRCVSALFPIWFRCHRPTRLSAIVCAVVWGLSVCLGITRLLCFYYGDFLYRQSHLAYIVMSFLTLLVLCASSLTLLVRVHCCSWQRPTTKLYRVIVLTVLAFLVLGLPVSIGFLVNHFFFSSFYFLYIEPVLHLLSVLNSAVNPVIYFFVGRQRQQPGRKSLRDALQSALTEDTC